MADLICVFAASSNAVDKKYVDLAYRLGEALAQADYGLVFGGGRIGLMGACARGVASRSGRIVGVIPEKLNRPGIAYERCDELIETRTMHERKSTMESLCAGFIALPGGFGTLEELLEVITLKQLGYHCLPIVILNYGGFYDPLIDQLDRCIGERFTNESWRGLYFCAEGIGEALEYLCAYRPGEFPDKMEEALSSK
ncbi:MAG: TIGR00730 family Rossman fold protein [Bacillota bacterium]